MRTVDRDRDADWEQGQRRRLYASNWVVVTLKRHLSPDNISLAHRLMDDWATMKSYASASAERIDCGNGEARKRDAACDASRRLEGYAQAVRVRFGHGERGDKGAECLWSIARGDSAEDLTNACGYRRGSYNAMVRLVQLTMSHAQDYVDGISGVVPLTDKANNGIDLAIGIRAPGA